MLPGFLQVRALLLPELKHAFNFEKSKSTSAGWGAHSCAQDAAPSQHSLSLSSLPPSLSLYLSLSLLSLSLYLSPFFLPLFSPSPSISSLSRLSRFLSHKTHSLTLCCARAVCREGCCYPIVNSHHHCIGVVATFCANHSSPVSAGLRWRGPRAVYGMSGLGFSVQVQGSGFRVQGSGFRVWGLGCGLQGAGPRGFGSEF